MIKSLLIIVTVLIVLGLGILLRLPNKETVYDSHITGRVLLGPTCPVMRESPDPHCADRPYPTTVHVIAIGSSKSSPFAIVETNTEGRYQIMLPSGQYSLQPVGGRPFPSCSAQKATIEPNTMLELDLFCDTGIR